MLVDFLRFYLLGWTIFSFIAVSVALWRGQDNGRPLVTLGDGVRCIAWNYALGLFVWLPITVWKLYLWVDFLIQVGVEVHELRRLRKRDGR